MHLDYATIKDTALWVLIAIAVVAVVLSIIIKKIVGKIITLVVAAVLVVLGWQQRAKVVDFANGLKVNACASHPHFVGIDVRYPGC